MKRIGRTPQWPNYFEREYPNRRLAILKGHNLYVENIGNFKVDELATLIDLLFSTNSLAFCESLGNKKVFPWLSNAVYSEHCEVLSDKEGRPLAARFRGKNNSSRWLIPASTWQRKDETGRLKPIDLTYLQEMREIFSYYKIVKPTPGSLGRAILRRSFRENNEKRQTAPNALALKFLRYHGVGGRCDTLVHSYDETGDIYPVLLELDMSSAYLAHFMHLPTGTSRWFRNGNIEPFVTYFAECDVTIHQELALGPFPVRTGRKESKIVYPTLPGTFHTYLWKEQIEDAQQAGCTVVVSHGIGWSDFTTCTSDFCRYMHHSRILHTGMAIEDDDKKIAVSTIGGFGMKQTYYRLTSDDDGRYPAVLDDNHNPLDYYIEEYTDYKQPSMLHWRDFCIKECNRTLYKYALPYAKEGRLIMTNYDALLIVEGDERLRLARKHSLEALMVEMGDLRWQELTNVRIYGDRSLECDQKRVRPGVPLEVAI